MTLDLVLGLMAEAQTEDELARAAPLAKSLPEEEKAIARWAFAYARQEIRDNHKESDL